MRIIGSIADRVARRHCTAHHQGASPCPYCAELRYVVVEAISEYLAELTKALRADLHEADREPEY